MVGLAGCSVLQGLPYKLDAERFSAAPNHLALCPVLASRENASRNLPANALESSIVSFAPVEDISRTTHRRAAKPPSRVIHPGWYSDLRASRFFLMAIASLPAENILGTSLPCGGFINRCYSRPGGGPDTLSLPQNLPPRGLPGRAKATIRSPAATQTTFTAVGGSRRQPQSLDFTVVFVFESQAKQRCRGRVGRGEAGAFAPFVYRLGRHPFTVERAVRFR